MVVVAFSFARSRFAWLGLLFCSLISGGVSVFFMSNFNVMLLKCRDCMYVYLSVYLSIYLPIYLSICLPIYLPIYACMYVCRYVCM